MRSADEIAYEITAVYYDDDKVANLIKKAREEMRQECIKLITENGLARKEYPPSLKPRRPGQPSVYAIELANAIRAIPNR